MKVANKKSWQNSVVFWRGKRGFTGKTGGMLSSVDDSKIKNGPTPSPVFIPSLSHSLAAQYSY